MSLSLSQMIHFFFTSLKKDLDFMRTVRYSTLKSLINLIIIFTQNGTLSDLSIINPISYYFLELFQMVFINELFYKFSQFRQIINYCGLMISKTNLFTQINIAIHHILNYEVVVTLLQIIYLYWYLYLLYLEAFSTRFLKAPYKVLPRLLYSKSDKYQNYRGVLLQSSQIQVK